MAGAIDIEIVRGEGKEQKRLDHYVPTLFIGLGGTGKDVLMRLRKRFYDEYASQKREFVRHLIVDTDMERWWPGGDASEEEYQPVRPKVGEHQSCQINEKQFYNVFDLLERQNDERFVSWLKPEMRNYGARAVIKGAGTHRQFGRMAFMLNYNEVRARIETHIADVLNAAATADSEALDGATVEQNTIEIVIVTSLAGGTGAGMFLDVAYVVKDVFRTNARLKNLKSKYSTLIAILPTPFEPHVDDSTYRKFQQNAYASLLELEHYGTPRTGDELFIGQTIDPRANKNRVGFVAPWKTGNQFIEGAGWEACYLVDNVNPLGLQTPLALDETYQMVADYLFLDFQRSEFAIQKRSNRCNLSQFQESHIETRVRKPATPGAATSSIHTDTDIVYATQNGCTFSSFGLAEVCFNRERVYRAAAYRLARHLVRQRWLGSEGGLAQSAYEDATKADFYNPEANAEQPTPPSFHPDKLVASVCHGQRGNWLAAVYQDFEAVRKMPFTQGSAALRKLHEKHEKLLAQGANLGAAAQTAQERAQALGGSAEVLGPLRERLRYAARRHANRHGVAVAQHFLDYYRKTLSVVAKIAGENESGSAGSAADTFARLAEADTVYFPARKLAQRIEFPRACDRCQSFIVSGYKRTTAPIVRQLVQKVSNYVGAKDERKSPELEHHGTLCEYLENAGEQLKKIVTRLEERFTQSREEGGTDRTQSLFPTTWDESKYDDQINRALVSYGEIGPNASGSGFDWEKLADLVFAQLRADQPRDFSEARLLTDLLDYWFSKHQRAEKDIVRIAEMLATACRSVLYKAKLNLAAFYEGSVIDLLTINYKELERKRKLERFLRASAPYLPLDMQAQANMTRNYRPVFDNLLGKKAGDIPNTSAANEAELIEELDAYSQEIGGEIDGEVKSKLDGEKSALVLCREVWGVPLQYYSFLGTLHDVYSRAGRGVDECHINHNESWEDLPDVRVIDPEVYEQIRDNVEHVLFAMIKGTITCRKDGAYIVKVPDRFAGVDTFRVGSRISRIIKKACEERAIREHLQRDRATWEQEASPKQWAIAFASALQTYEYSKREIKKDTDKHSSPLRNCFTMLLDRFQRQLMQTDEGRRWYDYLRRPNESERDFEQLMARHEAVFREIIDQQKVLFRASEHVPIYEVNWNRLDNLTLPAPPEPSAPLAVV
jgi:hypothetical protein